jgi:hypothetical protein
LRNFFSRASITRLEGRTVDRLHKLDRRLQEWVDSGKAVNLTHAIYSYVTGTFSGQVESPVGWANGSDIISSMLFEEPCDYLSDPTFNDTW